MISVLAGMGNIWGRGEDETGLNSRKLLLRVIP